MQTTVGPPLHPTSHKPHLYRWRGLECGCITAVRNRGEWPKSPLTRIWPPVNKWERPRRSDSMSGGSGPSIRQTVEAVVAATNHHYITKQRPKAYDERKLLPRSKQLTEWRALPCVQEIVSIRNRVPSVMKYVSSTAPQLLCKHPSSGCLILDMISPNYVSVCANPNELKPE